MLVVAAILDSIPHRHSSSCAAQFIITERACAFHSLNVACKREVLAGHPTHARVRRMRAVKTVRI